MLDFAQPGSNPGRSGGCQIALTTRLQQNCCLGERGLLVKFRPANPSRSGGCQDSRATRLQRNCWFDRRRSLMASVCIDGWQQTGGAVGTVAILAQGTHWAVAVTQAFYAQVQVPERPCCSSLNKPRAKYLCSCCRACFFFLGAGVGGSGPERRGAHRK